MEKIFEIIIDDLSKYHQDNYPPDSLTIKDNNGFRHYELGNCFGLVCYDEGHVMFTEIQEDDGNWFCFSEKGENQADAEWIKTKIDLYTRMNNWLLENMNRGYYSGYEGKIGFECGFTTFK